MKKIVTFFLFVLCIQTSKAQFVTIPDYYFRQWLYMNVPSAMSGNQMDTTSLAVTNRTTANVSNSLISDLTGIKYFSSLDTLICNNNLVTNLPILPNSITYLEAAGNQSLTTLPSLPTSLLSLNCHYSPLMVLPNLPSSLKILTCFGNQLTSLPTLPSSLIQLNCSGNLITSIPNLPNSLTRIVCSNNQLSSLPPLPSSLIELYCTNNQLTSLSPLPSLITILECQNNLLTSLSNLPNSLIRLSCAFNQLTSLPSLPNSLTFLNCSNNNINTLPALSSSLNNLYCSSNQLTSLPSLPTSLIRLYCSHNQIANILTFPISLTELDCSYNQLTSLPFLPVGLDVLVCSYNMISCFPVFPNIPSHYIQWGGPPILAFEISPNPFTCLPNYVGGMDTVTLNFPLCVSGNTLTNLNGCIMGYGITGSTFHDINLNCVKNITESGYTNTMVKLYNNSNQFMGVTSSGINGLYNFNVPTGTYHVVLDTVNKPFVVQCINPGIDSLVTLMPTQLVEDSVDFAIICKPGFDLGVQSIYRTGIVFPGITHTLTVGAGDMTQWNNMNCAAGIGGTVSFSVNGPISYAGPLAGALTPNITGNVYTYNIANFGTVDNFSDFRLALTTHTNAQVGDFICVNATVTPVNGDNVPSNNVLEFCYPVVNSYDPNIKEVYPVTVQSNYNDWLTYTIHFQNTGNAPAVNIRLEDDLDSKLNPETFQVMNYSHYNILDVKGNHLTVRFPNIQLVDSTTDRHGSIGFIQYRIKPNTGWVNDTIKNKASIYFDYNAPIITNTAKSYILMPTAVKEINQENGFDVYPNPSSSAISIKLADGSITSKTYSIKIMDVLGKEILTTNYKEEINISNLEKGIYFLSVYQNKALIGTKKVVKE